MSDLGWAGWVVRLCLGRAHPLGYTLSCDFFLSPKTQMALSARHLLHGLAPSHWAGQRLGSEKSMDDEARTLDFFSRHRSQALQTRFLMLSLGSLDPDRWGVDILCDVCILGEGSP